MFNNYHMYVILVLIDFRYATLRLIFGLDNLHHAIAEASDI